MGVRPRSGCLLLRVVGNQNEPSQYTQLGVNPLNNKSYTETKGTDVSEQMEELLCNKHINLPNGVLIDLLNKCTEDDRFLRDIGEQHRFSGEAALASAKSGAHRATVIAERTEDIYVINGLIELSKNEEFESVILHLADSKLIKNQTVLQKLHDLVFKEKTGSWGYNLIYATDASYILDYLEELGALGEYPVERFAKRLTNDAAKTGDCSNLHRFVKLCGSYIQDANQTHSKSYKVGYALGEIGKELAKIGATQLLPGLMEVANREASWSIALEAWGNSPLIDENVAKAAFSVLSRESFEKEQAQALSNRRGSDVPQYPNALRRDGLVCTDEALRLIGETWPGLLKVVLSRLANDNPQKDLIVELALKSKRADLAQLVVDRPFSQDDSYKGPILDARQYKTAANNIKTGIRNEHHGTPRYTLGGAVTVSYIPEGTDIKDVVKIWRKDSLTDIVETLVDHNHASWHVWRPDIKSFKVLLDECNPGDLRRAVRHGFYAYARHEDRPDEKSFELIEPYIDAAVERLAAGDVMRDHGGAVYVAHRLTERFGDDPEKWGVAWNLAKTATVSLEAVMKAAAKLA